MKTDSQVCDPSGTIVCSRNSGTIPIRPGKSCTNPQSARNAAQSFHDEDFGNGPSGPPTGPERTVSALYRIRDEFPARFADPAALLLREHREELLNLVNNEAGQSQGPNIRSKDHED